MRTGVHAGRHSHDSFEVPREMALIGKAHRGRHLHDLQPIPEQVAGALDPHVQLVRVRRKSELPRKRSHQVKPA